ncbi:MAG: alpha/beta fold hydrolase [Mariprofundaceae bacterium]
MIPLVFLHGWGQSQSIWHHQQHFRHAKFLNLPGHGGQPDSDDWLLDIEAQLPQKPHILIGWSLGGTLAIQLAQLYPKRIRGLVLVSSTACFRQKQGWSYGCSDEVWQSFKIGIQTQADKTMARFFKLMLHGENIHPRQYKIIQQKAIDKQHSSSEQGLQKGLELLGHFDLRQQLQAIHQPTLVLHGDNDAIIPLQAGRFITEQIRHSTQHNFEHCGHAPFLTQHERFNAILESWCQTI